MHAVAVVSEQGLRHEGRRLAVLPRGVLHDVFEPEQLVGHLDQAVVLHVDLTLAGRRDLVVRNLDGDPEGLHALHSVRPNILLRVVRRSREISLLRADLVAQVRPLVLARVPDRLARVDPVHARVALVLVPDVVEDEKLRLRPDVGRVGDARAFQVRLELFRDVTWVPSVALPRNRVLDRTEKHQGRVLNERVHLGGGRIGYQEHVAGVDGLKPPDRRPIEADAISECRLLQPIKRSARVLLLARKIDEPVVHHHRAALLAYLDYFLGCHCPLPSAYEHNPRPRAPPGRTSRLYALPGGRRESDRLFGSLTRADPDGLFDSAPEDLAVADAAGFGALLDGIDDLLSLAVGHHDLDLHLGHEIDDIRRPSVYFFLAASTAEALHLGDGHPLDPDLGERVFDFVQLERLDDGLDLFHSSLARSRDRRAALRLTDLPRIVRYLDSPLRASRSSSGIYVSERFRARIIPCVGIFADTAEPFRSSGQPLCRSGASVRGHRRIEEGACRLVSEAEAQIATRLQHLGVERNRAQPRRGHRQRHHQHMLPDDGHHAADGIFRFS